MKTMRIIIYILAFAGLLAFAIPSAHADAWNKRTKVVLHEPMEIPGGTVLKPGTYWFILLDSLSDRNIVRITNEAENHVYATILAIPNYRLSPTGDALIGLWETPRGRPVAIRSWFYPGDNFGQEFAYPKHAAEKIAAEEHAPVPSVPEELAPKLTIPSAPAPELKTAPVVVVSPPKEVAPAPAVTEETPAKATKMPGTASPLPLLALVGIVLTAMGLLLYIFRERIAKDL